MNDYCPRCDEVKRTYLLMFGEILCMECDYHIGYVDE